MLLELTKYPQCGEKLILRQNCKSAPPNISLGRGRTENVVWILMRRLVYRGKVWEDPHQVRSWRCAAALCSSTLLRQERRVWGSSTSVRANEVS